MDLSLEFYETPQTFTRYLFAEQPIAGALFEPCVGGRAILKGAALSGRTLNWDTNDLDPRWSGRTCLDATKAEAWRGRSIDWTVSNPPFSPAIEIIEQALTHSRIGVAMHLRASIHEVLKTGKRRTFLAEHTPTGILWLPRFAYQRSKTTGKWTTDSVCACWVIWLKDPAAQQFIRYAPEWVLNDLESETPAYRARMDALMKVAA